VNIKGCLSAALGGLEEQILFEDDNKKSNGITSGAKAPSTIGFCCHG
jgi:hypothetical protein